MANGKLTMKALTAKKLRAKYPRFVYEKYDYKISRKNLEIVFYFSIEPGIRFTPKIIIGNINKAQIKRVGERTLKNLIFHLGLSEIPSYWKTTCSPEIIIKAGSLDNEQKKWWRELLINGLGQFFYENKIDFRPADFLKITNEREDVREVLSKDLRRRILVPIGNGKDSIVTLELLKNAGKEINCFCVNPRKPFWQIIRISNAQKPIIIHRYLDKKLFQLNRAGFLNGHTPFSALLAFYSVFAAIIFDYKYIAFSNERSADEGNVKYLGKEINHQWSKSSVFEKSFRAYCQKHLAGKVEYFSFLRPLYELQIAEIFSRFPKYFPVFLSCNNAYFRAKRGIKVPAQNLLGEARPLRGRLPTSSAEGDFVGRRPSNSRAGKWCGRCPKCLFTFLILYPFIEESRLVKIFGENLLDKKELLPLLKALIGETPVKPFECVGTRKESQTALHLCQQKAKRAGKVPFLLKHMRSKTFAFFVRSHKNYKSLVWRKEAEKLLSSWGKQNNLPSEFGKILKPPGS